MVEHIRLQMSISWLEHYLLYFHLVKVIISFLCLGERHNVLEHEPFTDVSSQGLLPGTKRLYSP
jgi:hypothetical protein